MKSKSIVITDAPNLTGYIHVRGLPRREVFGENNSIKRNYWLYMGRIVLFFFLLVGGMYLISIGDVACSSQANPVTSSCQIIRKLAINLRGY